MSSCDVCLSGCDGYAEFFYEEERKAQKVHKCYECHADIQPKEKYWRVGGKYEGDMWRASLCQFCWIIGDVFSCDNGREFGNMWEDMENAVFPYLTVSSPCFQKLSVDAREFLTKRWWEWKER